MLTRRSIILLALLAACGGTSAKPEWVGNWQTAAPLPGSYVSMTLGGTGASVSGSGTFHREAGAPTDFTVSGTPPSLTFTYQDNSTEALSYAQPDVDHLTLSNAQRTLSFARVSP